MLSAEHLARTRGLRDVVSDVSLTVDRGEAVALLGPNGAGKTTVFQMIIGMIRPDRGRIYLDDNDITALPVFERARRGLNYLPLEPSVFHGLTVEQNILLELEISEPDRVSPWIAAWTMPALLLSVCAATVTLGSRIETTAARFFHGTAAARI